MNNTSNVVVLPRGIRNNNPLNIRHMVFNHWVGLSGIDSGGFCKFRTMRDGIRAAIKLLCNYYDKYDLHTPRQIIARWAPPSENRTETYIRVVCNFSANTFQMRLYPDDYLDRSQLPYLAYLMAIFENGQTAVKANLRILDFQSVYNQYFNKHGRKK